MYNIIFCLVFLLCCRVELIRSLRPISSRRVQKISRNAYENMNLEGWTPPSDLSTYEFIPPEVGPEIYAGSAIALIPIIWATYEFTNRIRIQQECLICTGSGLVYKTKSGNALSKARKCWNCGGFLPWLGWKMFFLSGLVDPGNGGVLLRPSEDYDLTQERERLKAESSKSDVNNEIDIENK